MNETLTNFRQAVADSADLQEKVKAGADLVALGKENGYEFTQEELTAGWNQTKDSPSLNWMWSVGGGCWIAVANYTI